MTQKQLNGLISAFQAVIDNLIDQPGLCPAHNLADRSHAVGAQGELVGHVDESKQYLRNGWQRITVILNIHGE